MSIAIDQNLKVWNVFFFVGVIFPFWACCHISLLLLVKTRVYWNQKSYTRIPIWKFGKMDTPQGKRRKILVWAIATLFYRGIIFWSLLLPSSFWKDIIDTVVVNVGKLYNTVLSLGFCCCFFVLRKKRFVHNGVFVIFRTCCEFPYFPYVFFPVVVYFFIPVWDSTMDQLKSPPRIK